MAKKKVACMVLNRLIETDWPGCIVTHMPGGVAIYFDPTLRDRFEQCTTAERNPLQSDASLYTL